MYKIKANYNIGFVQHFHHHHSEKEIESDSANMIATSFQVEIEQFPPGEATKVASNSDLS